MTITCEDLENAPSCCGSCHDDADEGYEDLFEFTGNDENTYRVCCKVAMWLEQRGIK